MKLTKIEKISTKMGGSTLTKVARNHSIKHLSEFLRSNGRNMRDLSELKARDVRLYVIEQQQAGASKRTLQNRLSHVRTALREVGRHQLANSPHLSCKTLGIDQASRNGTHQALSQAQYEKALELAQRQDQGFAACLALQRTLGLRAREAVQCSASLKGWERALERGQPIRVLHGTKGGRPRDVGAVDQDMALKAVKTALEALKIGHGTNECLVQSKTLQGAMRAFGRHCEAVGLVGEHASHSLRCMYAQERFAQHLQNLGDRREALAATSQDLGHGDGRGTYVAQVYLARPASS